MDGDNATFDINSQYSNGLEISENATILEEGLRVCPLCQSEIKLFFINLNEKLMMCENVECEYPFGYEDLQFFKEDNNVNAMDELCSIQSKRTTDNVSATCSVMSAAAWSEIDRMNRVFESEDSQQFDCLPNIKTTMKTKKDTEKDENVLKNVEFIKGLNMELKEINGDNKRRIANKRYIKNLLSLQSMTGVEMLQPEERKILDKGQEIGEVKIDVNTDAENCISCIKIELVDVTNLEKAIEDSNDGNINKS